ncbi:MAG: O-methyltransferase [Ignavibacteria bacterium]|jgi:predicted O-methyltransferase YrrM|nr:O-methyltransferase [Ignavibacteria bacterium]MCU7503055.1 O-methyltransferase [Ignavibacteria bacterium]MCU7516525.1 O-methyltransferase [Ignavibacteria bacterium]
MENIICPEQQAYLETLRKEEDPLIIEMEEYAKEHRVPILNWKAVEFMEQLILAYRPRRVLEIGTAIAYSSIHIARSLRKKGKLVTIELSSDNVKIAKENVRISGFGDKIKLIHGNALEVMPGMKKKFDLIFLDADKEDYKALFEFSMELLKKGGVIFVDNLLWHGYAASKQVPKKFQNSTGHIREFNKEFLSHPDLTASILPIGDGIGFGVKKR